MLQTFQEFQPQLFFGVPRALNISNIKCCYLWWLMFTSSYSKVILTCLDCSCLQASITVMTCLVRGSVGLVGSMAILLQANYSYISNQSRHQHIHLEPSISQPPSPSLYIGSCKLTVNIAQCLSTLYNSGPGLKEHNWPLEASVVTFCILETRSRH